jgi:hypothetical protein
MNALLWLRAKAVVLSIGLAWTLPSSASTEVDLASNNVVRGPYVQLATPRSIFVVWRTHGPINPVVRFGVAPERFDRRVGREATIVRVALSTNVNDPLRTTENRMLPKLHSAASGTFQYEARLTGLTPDAAYYYAVFDGEKRLTPPDESYRFRTHPLIGQNRPVRFWAVGDSGTGRETQAMVQQSMIQLTRHQRRPIDLYLHVGDMAYTRGRDVEFQSRFFEMYDTTLRNTVCWAAMGNHEGATSKGTNGVGPYYDAYVLPTRGEAGGLPSGMEAYYSFDYGRVHFICLDSHDLDRKPTGAMAKWLKADLERTKADWLIAFWHHPPYTKGSHDSDREKQLIEMRRHIMPIMESGGVDLVLTGHSHIYERSMLMDGAYATPTVAEGVILDDGDGDPRGDGPYRKSAGLHPNEGNVQVVTGHGGTTVRRKGTMPVMKRIIYPEHGSVIVDIAGDTLTSIMLNKYGEQRDLFSMVKRGRVTPVRLLNPWQPPAWEPPKVPDGQEGATEPPEDFITLIPQHAEWHYLAGTHPSGSSWMKLDFDARNWKLGQAGFGYGYKDARTELPDMKGKYSVIYTRREFEVETAEYVAEIGVMANYDDGFVAYLNGHEVVRRGVGKGSGKDAKEIKAHDAGKYFYYPLKDFEKHLKDGPNVLAIEGYNVNLDSSDFLLDAYLILED